MTRKLAEIKRKKYNPHNRPAEITIWKHEGTNHEYSHYDTSDPSSKYTIRHPLNDRERTRLHDIRVSTVGEVSAVGEESKKKKKICKQPAPLLLHIKASSQRFGHNRRCSTCSPHTRTRHHYESPTTEPLDLPHVIFSSRMRITRCYQKPPRQHECCCYCCFLHIKKNIPSLCPGPLSV